MLFAESLDVTTNAVTLGGGFAAFMALVAWILKSALPSLLRDFGDRLDKLQATHDVSIANTRTEFRQELAAFRADNAATRTEFMQELARMRVTQDKTADAVTALTNELHSMQACHMSEDRGPRRNVPATM